MHLELTCLSVLLLAIFATGKSPYRVHSKVDVLPHGFARAKNNASIDDTSIDLRFALAPSDTASLQDVLSSVSTPGSSSYGKYLTKEEVKTYMQPTDAAVYAVKSWLQSAGIQNITTSGAYSDWLSVTVPISIANTLLDASFTSYVHAPSGERIVRTLQYSLPENLFPHIKIVHPGTSFALMGNSHRVDIPLNLDRRQTSVPECAKPVTPACLQALYGFPSSPATHMESQLAVNSFQNNWANKADLQLFLTAARPDMDPTTTFSEEATDGGTNSQDASRAGSEANLDTQWTVGVATDVPVVLISVGSNYHVGVYGYIDAFDYISSKETPPTVVSTSWGYNEVDLGPEYPVTMCNQYLALGVRGVSVIFSSGMYTSFPSIIRLIVLLLGDYGVAGATGKSVFGCSSRFVPEFPSSCPFATSVGSTNGVPEEVATFSGGGFSDLFERPSYQDASVQSYIDSIGEMYSGLYNTTGRGFPDLSAQGQFMQFALRGGLVASSGTSFSAPIIASMVSLLNNRLLDEGRPTLGFLNPFLYANPQAFSDITVGSNPGCSTNGFAASAGWDPASGLGTPIYSAILAALDLN